MNAQTCLEKLSYVGVLSFATVDEWGAPLRCGASAPSTMRRTGCTSLPPGGRTSAGSC